jgi:hypothetical protein
MRSGLRLALLKSAALPEFPQQISPITTVVGVYLYLSLVLVILFKLFIAWQCSAVASWCTLCKGMPRFSRGAMVYWL